MYRAPKNSMLAKTMMTETATMISMMVNPRCRYTGNAPLSAIALFGVSTKSVAEFRVPGAEFFLLVGFST